MIRLLVCEAGAEVREAIRSALTSRRAIEIVGEVEDTDEAVARIAAAAPDVVLVGTSLPPTGGADAVRRIRALSPAARLVAFAQAPDPDAVGEMIEAGAEAYCVNGTALWELERAITGIDDPFVRLVQGLSRSATARGVPELIARELAELVGGGAAVYLAAPDVGLSLAALAGAGERARLASPPGLAVRAFRSGALARAEPLDLQHLAATGIRCADAAAVPLVHHGETLGALFAAASVGAALPIDGNLLAAVADMAASATATERRVALTHAEARRDALTGLPNRRAFDERIAAALAGAANAVSIALLDLDDFKEVNDRLGHPAGDEVLRQVARVAQRCLRATDQLYRLGGDEFALVVSGGAAEAGRLADRVRRSLLGHRRAGPLPTVSAGVAAYPRDADSRDELLRRADHALYSAKRGGRNRVVSEAGATDPPAAPSLDGAGRPDDRAGRSRVLVVDDDDHLRELLRTTLEFLDLEILEAATGTEARAKLAAVTPDVVVLDVGLPDADGLSLCRELKNDPTYADVAVVVLTGADAGLEAQAAGAEAFLRKPFSPLELLALVERLLGDAATGPVRTAESIVRDDQLLVYAEDLRRLLEVEVGQRALLQRAYRETVAALAAALESKDVGTGAHSQRVQRYAAELAWTLNPSLLDDPTVEYGFLLHDVGKIGIPDGILRKPGPLTEGERRLLQNHTILGEQMLGGVALLQGEGIRIVRSHHERWDGRGYPDGLAGTDIPLGARVFAVADTLDAITSDRPYRKARSWEDAAEEIYRESSRQFDPDVVGAFRDSQPRLRRVYEEFAAAV
jgi:ribonuclease P protein subunit RPR2